MPSEEPTFVDEKLRFLKGDEAARALASTSDEPYLTEQGVVQVPRSRWLLAQEYERRTWTTAGAHADDDRNLDHRDHFDGYRPLAGLKFERAIELGCGPFTNLRLIAAVCRIGECTLLDPLIEDYLHHRHCRFTRRRLRTGETALGKLLGRNLGGRALRRLLRSVFPQAVERGIAVTELLAVPIEEMPERDPFDLVVMINVIEHCYDAPAIFSRLLRMTRPGSIFVFHDKWFDREDVASEIRHHFDAGHPLRVSGAMIESFLKEHFDPLLNRTARVADELDGIDLSHTGVYFIGRRR
ncbi:MAG TPA: methyltransferase domain-containing protein [Thermoanaerobaculia bacterium]|nr:methyltransferase domain-containing protein [Thermoanaerobaculia bacterium]